MSAHTVATPGAAGDYYVLHFLCFPQESNGEQDKLFILISVQTQLSLPELAITSQETTKALGA